MVKEASVQVRGMPKCGRFWKTPKTKYESCISFKIIYLLNFIHIMYLIFVFKIFIN